ncbi:MAG: electron transfer flavoprotein subunit beta/FixA family protein [Candidatus Manganitrophaceae bacterium]|nr:MAG: electron transfer flavoprotein subunit beta/FixA family protein [Candidatus Manganitrophaceae bacterium]
MNIAVCIKQVPASESKVKPSADGKDIDRTGLTYVVNPYDEFGVEEALRIKERLKTGQVTIVTLGPDKAAEALRTCLAVGADQAIHIKDPALEGGDAYTTALALAAALKRSPYDILFFGRQAIDDDNGAVGIHVADLMGLPHVAGINKLEIDAPAKKAVAHRQIEGAIEVVEVSLPAIFTCQKGLNEPRYASLPGIMKAKQKPLAVLTLADLGLDPKEVGSSGAKLVVEKIESPPVRSEGKIIEGEPAQAVAELVRVLREEIKVL